MIAFKCATCGKDYKLPDNTAGRKARCKACGEAMVVPEAPDDLFDDGPAMGDDLTSLYASNEPSEVIEQPAVAEDPLAFNPEVAFQRSDKPAATPQLPMKLIIGAGSGVLGLIVIVVVIVIVMAGGDDAGDTSTNGLAFNTEVGTSSDASANPFGSTPRPERVTPEPTTPDTDTPDPRPETNPADPDVETNEPETPVTNESEDDADTDAEPETDVEPQFVPVAVPGLLAPTSSDYALVLPDELELISQTRVAVRSAPLEDGTWLSMEVHKLAGLDRRAESVVSEDGSTVLLRGRRIVVPAGVEISEIVSDRYTIKRLLYPVQTGSDIRRVEYVIKDGPYLISVLGRYPASDAARLVMLDDAAKSVQPLEDQ